MECTALTLSMIFSLGIVCGFVGSSAGGGSLLALQCMLAMGFPVIECVCATRLASIGAAMAGTYQFYKRGKIDFTLALGCSLFGIIGSLLGSYLLYDIEEGLIKKIVSVTTLLLFFLSIGKNYLLSRFSSNFKKILEPVGYLLFIATGMVGGFVGGQAILATYIYVFFFQKTMSESLGTRKISTLAVSIAAAIFLGIGGHFNWMLTAILVPSTMIGSSLGSFYVLQKGDLWISRVFSVVTLLLSIFLLFDIESPQATELLSEQSETIEK